MGNSAPEHIPTEEELLYAAEKEVLAFSGLPFEDFQIENIAIDDEGNYMRTFQVGDVSEDR